MRVLVLHRDQHCRELWFIQGDYQVLAETTSAYKVRRAIFFYEWIPKNSIGIKCKVLK